MSQRAPQTLSVKRKRTEAPVDSLIFDNSVKRQRSEADIFFRRLTKPGDAPLESGTSTPATERRFHLDPVSRARSKHVFIERRATDEQDASTDSQHAPVQEPAPQEPPRPRKRPGTRAASTVLPSTPLQKASHRTQPSEHDVRELEALSHKLAHDSSPSHTSPSKYKPKAPTRRFADREPEKAAALAARDGSPETMDIDTDDYVIDTYIRETIIPSSDGTLPPSIGTIGILILHESDEDWWNGSDSDDKEFASDDDDSNAEEYYANDYPEDELSDDDEFGRDPYKKNHRHGSDDEEFDAEESADDAIGSGEDEDDLHYKMTVPKAQRTGYWGMVGQ